MATVTHITSPVKIDHTNGEIITICCAWSALIEHSSSYVGGGSSLDAFLETLMIGRLAHLLPTSFGDKVSLCQCEIALDSNIDKAEIFFKDVEPVSAATLRTRFSGFIRRTSLEGHFPKQQKACSEYVPVVQKLEIK